LSKVTVMDKLNLNAIINRSIRKTIILSNYWEMDPASISNFRNIVYTL